MTALVTTLSPLVAAVLSAILTIAGVGLVATAHIRNLRAAC